MSGLRAISFADTQKEERTGNYVDKRDVLETFADLYDVFEDSKEITAELHKVYDKLNNLPYVCDTSISCSRANDLISRQKAIDFFNEVDRRFPHRVLRPEQVRDILMRLPSAQPKRKMMENGEKE